MVPETRFKIYPNRNDPEMLTETAVIRSTYVRWCGGTAAYAASYPIRKIGMPVLQGA
jgi:hypothetical protein